MFILLIILTVALLFLGVVPIGVLITSLLIRQCSDCSMHSLIDLTVFCIFFGLAWCTAWFYLALIGPFDHSNVPYLMWVKLSIDSVALAWVFKKYYRPKGWINIRNLHLNYLIQGIGTFYAVAFGVIGMLFRPMATDNSALSWLAAQVVYGSFNPAGTEGSPFYLAWLLSPAVLLQHLFLIGNIAAVLKIASSLLLWLMSLFFVEHVIGRDKLVLALVLFSFVLATFLGDYGVFKTAKETPIGMLFLIGFFAQAYVCWDVVESHRPMGDFVLLGMLAALAIGFAAVTVPYLALLLSIMALTGTVGFRAVFWTLACGVLVIPFSFSSMLEIPLEWAVLGYLTMLSLIAFARHKASRLFWVLDRCQPLLVAFLGVSVILACGYLALVMPLKYNAVPYWPLDGKTEFHDLIYDLPWIKGLGIGGITGIGLMFVRAVREKLFSLILFVGFPWFALALIFSVASFQDSELTLSSQNVWDLAKDIPNWWLGIYYAIGVVWLIYELTVFVGRSTLAGEVTVRYGFTIACIVTTALLLIRPFKTYLITDEPAFQAGAVFHEKADVAKAMSLIQATRRVDHVGMTKLSTDKIFISDYFRVWSEDGYSSSELGAMGIEPVIFRPTELEWLDTMPEGVSMLVLMEKGLEKIVLDRRGGQKIDNINDKAALYLVGIPDDRKFSLGSDQASEFEVSPLY
jgi:hypothetical protein